MNTTETKKTETLKLTGTVEFSGIIKLTFDSVAIPDCDTRYKGILKKNLKQHITLCHQSVPKLLDKKAIKKHLKENRYELTVNINLEKHSFLISDEKQALVYYPTESSSIELREWTDSFLQKFTEKNITELRNTTLDKDRVFHLSYMNKSGNPGDSIAIIW